METCIGFKNWVLHILKSLLPQTTHLTTPTTTNKESQTEVVLKMEQIEHKMVAVNGINMHVAELGKGPTVLLIHGFPELWYTWRHQILYLASHGYRAIAPDLRGYGDTTGAPISDPAKFTTLHVVGDLVALIDAVAGPGENNKVFVVAHDWGAVMAWALCLYRPDKVKALVALSVPFSPRNPKYKPLDALQHLYGKDYYITRFQEPGEIEGEFAVWGTERVLSNFFNFRKPEALCLPKGIGFGTSPDDPITLPSWISKEDLAYYTSKFEKTGFTGGLNYYRALNINWELTAPWTGAQIKVPVKFIVGDLDLTYHTMGAKDYIQKGGFKKDVPLLEDVVILQGVAHFLHEEKPDEINQHIHHFIQHFSVEP
uniref:epoxide hydrolase A-like n=1 Tax=Erigeron canadensis TaxID=72917 RepID=UPI001CB99E96|nr:epoxide hydrolase A-like [Erigeron canadensis]